MSAPRTELAPMRDGAGLATDVYLPADERPAPALLVRTPYGRTRREAIVYGDPRLYAARGYAVVCQDVRGRGESEGEFAPFAQEGPDGHDAVEWVAAQPWCDGRVGMYGFSYPGFAQLAAAAERPPHLRAVAPAMTAADPREEWLYEGGALRLAFLLWWGCELGKDGAVRAGDEEALYELFHLQGDLAGACLAFSRRRSLPAALERVAPYVREWVTRAGDEEWWAKLSAPPGPAAAPSLFLAGWHDTFLEGTIAAFRLAAAAGPPPQRLVIGPWQHVPWARRSGDLEYGPAAASRVDEWALEFFDATLGGGDEAAAALGRDPVRVFVTGADRWLDLPSWPPPGDARSVFHLAGERANSSDGDGELAPEPAAREAVERYVVDPWDPARSVGGRSCCDPAVTPIGPRDRAAEQQRRDRLVFDSAPLRDPLAVVGSPRVSLDFEFDTPSTDLVVRLCDVGPGGESYGVSERAVRLGEPGRTAPLELSLSPLATRFGAGHRVRLELTGADFPARELNLQTGGDGARESLAGARVGTHSLRHGGRHRSLLELPLHPDPTLEENTHP